MRSRLNRSSDGKRPELNQAPQPSPASVPNGPAVQLTAYLQIVLRKERASVLRAVDWGYKRLLVITVHKIIYLGYLYSDHVIVKTSRFSAFYAVLGGKSIEFNYL